MKVQNAILRLVTERDRKERGQMKSYGKKLIELRGEKSQSVVAEAIGIATSTLGMYETEQRIPRDAIKIALANYYNTTVQNIFFDEIVT
ncbi:MAG: helix-turn-helix transcriptional regulator [Eubacteriales bacterium]